MYLVHTAHKQLVYPVAKLVELFGLVRTMVNTLVFSRWVLTKEQFMGMDLLHGNKL
jgi:hypothetical protein